MHLLAKRVNFLCDIYFISRVRFFRLSPPGMKKIVSSLSAFLIILCISRRASPFSVRAHGSGQLSARHPVFRHSLRKCPPRGRRRARYILLPLAHDRGAPSSYANLSQISHGISLEIHNRRPLRIPAVPLAPPAAGGAGEKTHDTKEISKQSTLKINYFADGS